MTCKLDWLSFTFPVGQLGEKDNEYTLRHVISAFNAHSGEAFTVVHGNSLWEWTHPEGFYPNRITHPTTGVSLSFGGNNQFGLCQLSGAACDRILLSIPLALLMRSTGNRATRVDLAIDIEGSCSPAEFVAARGTSRITSYGRFVSQTGETAYIGSRKSDRMARVYRYNPPHPRAHLLRVEVELKGEAAQITCSALSKLPLTEVCLSVNAPFAWKHECWRPRDLEITKIAARTYRLKDAGTLLWLNTTVVSAIRKAAQTGVIDLREWMKDNFPEEFA